MEKICDFFAGIVVLRLIKGVITPPAVSIPSVKGVTSSSKSPSVCLLFWPVKIDAWTAAPVAERILKDMLNKSSLEVGNSFVGVDGAVQLLATEKIRNQLLDLGDRAGALKHLNTNILGQKNVLEKELQLEHMRGTFFPNVLSDLKVDSERWHFAPCRFFVFTNLAPDAQTNKCVPPF